MSFGTTYATQARRPRSILRLRRTRCAILPPMRWNLRVRSTSGPRIWQESVSAGWSLRLPRSSIPRRSPRSPSSRRVLSLQARSTTIYLSTTRRQWGRLFARSMPNWSDRDAVAAFAAEGAEILGDDSTSARTAAGRKWDHTPSASPAVQLANQLGTVFAVLDCQPRWRERLSEVAIPTLVVHGRHDRFFPVGNGEALAREIAGAKLLVLEQAATAIPEPDASKVAAAMLELGQNAPPDAT